jgi:hypothetical protein
MRTVRLVISTMASLWLLVTTESSVTRFPRVPGAWKVPADPGSGRAPIRSKRRATVEVMDRDEETNRLGAYLRARRDLVTPEQAGIPAGPNRRVAGLRREEVAMLAGISADYYLWCSSKVQQPHRPRLTSKDRFRCPDVPG